jgi:hypothetical protein
MEDKKSKKKTLTLSTTLTKKIDISSLNKDGKKSYSIEKKKPFKSTRGTKKTNTSSFPSTRTENKKTFTRAKDNIIDKRS